MWVISRLHLQKLNPARRWSLNQARRRLSPQVLRNSLNLLVRQLSHQRVPLILLHRVLQVFLVHLQYKLLTFWEKELESCGAIQLQNAALYGIGPCASTRIKHKMKCSNDSTYEDFRIDEKLAYTSEKEYNEAKGIVPDDLVESCPQEDFALFPDILADVQKELYKKIVDELMIDSSLTEAQIKYLENLLDRENKTLKVGLAPYYLENRPVERSNLNYMAENWFDGYIAKTKTCEDGTPEITERYKQKYDAILAECMEIIRNNVKTAVAGE